MAYNGGGRGSGINIGETKMVNQMPRLSTFHAAAILFSLFSACSIQARTIATISAGSVAGVIVPAGKGSNNGNVQKHGNNSSAPVKQKHKRVFKSNRPGVPVPMSKEFLKAHNKIRASANEPPMKWDKSLARYARRWASKRAVDCRMIHSFGDYGENIFWGEKDVWTPSEIVESWASEVEHFDKTKNACTDGQICGHYTQLVWLDSTKLGCAKVKCFNGSMYTICNYNPPGNFVDESPFTHFNG